MREKGYAAVSARNVAERAGLNYQLVFYYFPTMDDLLLATYQRRTQRLREGTERVLGSERPLHALWKAWSEPSDAALTLEFMALSNHNERVRAETIAFGEFIRRFVAEQLAGRVRESGLDGDLFTPFAVSLTLSSLGAILGFEAALGISGGHADTRSLVEWGLQHLEPAASLAEPAAK